MLSKMDVKDAFRQVAVEWDGGTKFETLYRKIYGETVVPNEACRSDWLC